MAEKLFIPMDEDAVDIIPINEEAPRVIQQIANPVMVVNAANKDDQLVYVTARGKCYHRKACQYNIRGQEVTIRIARTRYHRRACLICNP